MSYTKNTTNILQYHAQVTPNTTENLHAAVPELTAYRMPRKLDTKYKNSDSNTADGS
jgi:phosphoribosylanthranilate isomerase